MTKKLAAKNVKNSTIVQAENLFLNHSEEKDIQIFTRENRTQIADFRSIFLRDATYGTSETPYIWKDTCLIAEIKSKLKENRFFLIHGNSGRGKTFFIFYLIEKLVITYYAQVIYYSPQFNMYSQNASLPFDDIERYLSKNKPLLLIIDDSHLLNNTHKKKLFFLMSKYCNLHILLVSRQKEDMGK